MKMQMIKVTMFASLLLASLTLHAEEDVVTIIKIADPIQSTGIHIGDVLHRSIELEVKAPYQIAKTTLPLKGMRTDGIELADISVKSNKSGSATHYIVDMSYQVFANSLAPVVMQLPAESIAMTGGPQAVTTDIPAWNFWFSPLVQGGIGVAKTNMQPQQKPSFLAIQSIQLRLSLWLGILLIGLVGIIYINADRRWLPFMGGVFAQAHRQIKRLSKTKGQEKESLIAMHQAFNRAYGENLFAQDIGAFIAKYPHFEKARTDIETFFKRSNESLFSLDENDTELSQYLLAFSKQQRDCERGI